MGFFSVAEERPRITIVWRDGRWVPVLRRSHRTLRLIAEGVAMSALSCAIVALGGVAGFYVHRKEFNAQGQRFAEDSMKAIMSSKSTEALMARASPELIAVSADDAPAYLRALRKVGPGRTVNGCVGCAHLELLNPKGLVFANYTCEIRVKSTLAVADMRLRRDPDDWKITAFYVSSPLPLQPSEAAARTPCRDGGAERLLRL